MQVPRVFQLIVCCAITCNFSILPRSFGKSRLARSSSSVAKRRTVLQRIWFHIEHQETLTIRKDKQPVRQWCITQQICLVVTSSMVFRLCLASDSSFCRIWKIHDNFLGQITWLMNYRCAFASVANLSWIGVIFSSTLAYFIERSSIFC